MVAWANGGYGDRVRFLMLCVETGRDGLRTAQTFGEQFRIPATVLNAYIDSRSEAPKYGQLGCGGFIVLGMHGEFVATRTVPAYLDKGALAFTAVERILGSLGVHPATESIAEGASTSQKDSKTYVPLQVASVGNTQMDEEHEGLVRACADFAAERSLASLNRLRAAWAEHSEHEEALFEKHDFAGHRGRGELAGTKSHCSHHRAILASLDQARRQTAACANGNCCAPGLVDAQVANEIVAEMQRHSDVFDSAYAGKLLG